VNGLITPCRPMSLEAAAGKNPVSHVGKIYSVVSRQLAESVAAEISEIAHARCLMVGQIGAPVTRPAVIAVDIVTQDGRSVAGLRNQIEAVVADRMARIPALADDFVNGTIELF
jgi:S-adenosylmethionine synthetase